MFIQVNQVTYKTFIPKSKKDVADAKEYTHIPCGSALINTDYITNISVCYFTYDDETFDLTESKAIYEVRFNNKEDNILIDKESYDKVCKLLANKKILKINNEEI